MKKNGKKETRHLAAMAKPESTACGRPIGKVLVWAKKTAPKPNDATVCIRCIRGRDRRIVLATRETGKVHKEDAQDLRVARKRLAEIDGSPKPGKRQPALLILGDRLPEIIEVTFKGKRHVADVIQDAGVHSGAVRGTIRVDALLFNSPSRAGKHVAGREVDGWTFWSYLKADGTLEKLDALRKAVA
jgi:hypothetical protein